MRIVIDGRMIHWTGVGRYTVNLLDELQKQDQQNQYLVIMSSKQRAKWRPSSPNFEVLNFDAPPYHPIKEQFGLARFIASLKPDLVHFTAINRPAFYKGRTVTTIHDLQMLDPTELAAWYKRYKLWGLKFVAKRVVASTDRIIVPLEHTRDVLNQRFPGAAAKTMVINEAAGPISDHPRPVEPLANHQFLLYVGNAYPHKNLPRLLDAFGTVAADHPTIQLALAGNMGPAEEELKQRVSQLNLSDRVVWLGYISDSQLAWAYEHSAAVVLPSISEGFGLQALEAMCHRAPVLAANNGAYSEVCEGAALYFDPLNPDGMAARITQLLEDRSLRQSLIQAGQQRLKHFSWAKMATQTLEVYRDALDN